MTRIKTSRKKARAKAAILARASQQPVKSSLDTSLGYLLRRAQIAAFQQFGEFMDDFELRPAQYAVIVLIGSNPGLTQSKISGALGIQRANFVAMIDQLETREIVERRKVSGDRRSFALHLTQSGEGLLRRIEKVHARYERRLVERLGQDRTNQLLALLRDFGDSPRPSG